MKAQLNGAEERSVAIVKDLDEAKIEAVAARLLAKAAAELRGRLTAVSENNLN